MDLEWDHSKREATLAERNLDFDDARTLFEGVTLTVEDDRQDYGEPRYQSLGQIGEDVVMVVWTPRGERRRIISMRRCDAKERKLYQGELARSG